VAAQGQRLVYESGEWEIDLARRELRARAAPVPIGSRAFDIIEVLVRSAGELVTKHDLASRVWPGGNVVLFCGPGNHVNLPGLPGGAERIRTSDLQHDAVDAGDQLREPVAPLLERALAEVLAVEAEEVEGDEAGPRAAGLCAQRSEVASPIGKEHDRLAVDQCALGGQLARRFRDPRQPVGEIRAVAGPQRDALALV
jgi:hypothetical protein